MAMTRRGRSLAVLTSALTIIAIVVVVLVVGGRKGLGPLADDNHDASPSPTAPHHLRICPLTGVRAPTGLVPERPALAVKVENLPSARPQTGLSWADIIYEEPVEAGITRFIAVYQCQDAARIEPVRSGRLTDPDILRQFGHTVFGYAGGVPQVINKVRRSGLVDVNFRVAPARYHRDPARPVPHNLYTSTRELYAAGRSKEGPPSPVFTYSREVPTTGTSVSAVHIPFSDYSDVNWAWSASKGEWMRSYGSEPATYSDGSQIGTRNVVIQMVKVVLTGITDVNGVHSPEVVATGSGTCYVLRNGKMIKGTWTRSTLGDLTTFRDGQGNVIPLQPGKTWVELVPRAIPVTTG